MNAGILSLWGVWDAIYQRCTRLQYVDKGKNIFRIVQLRYRGEVLTTADGQLIRPGDRIIKLHIHNYYLATRFQGITSDTRMGLLLRQYILISLPQLAAYVASLPQAEQIKGIVGTTMLAKGAEQLGFSVSEVPMTLFFRYKSWYLKLMLSLIHPDGFKRVRNQPELVLKRVYMSKDELFRRYLPQAVESGNHE
ncbi:MAG: hypothetical protein H0Z34_15070 [Brevibacillus sp.]|nr:hypothetical protein [Brevibacillus sp.]